MTLSFGKDKMVPLKAVMSILIVADHIGYFWSVPAFRIFAEFGAPIVSVFFFISGYGLQTSLKKKGDAYLKSFFRNRFLKLLIPYLLATLLYVFLLWSPDRDLLTELKATIMEGIPILPYSWFVIELLYFYLVFYITSKLFQSCWKMIAVTLCACVIIPLFILAGYGRSWWVCSLAFPAGVIFAGWEDKLYKLFTRRPASYWMALLSLLAIFAIAYFTYKPTIWPVCYICIPCIVALIVARLPIEKLSSIPAVAFISAVSYEIYLCQGIPMELFRQKFSIHSDTLFVCAVYTVTILLAYLVHLISARIYKACISSTT